MNKLPLQKMHSCYRNYCIIVTESAALLLPKTLHFHLPKLLHSQLPLPAIEDFKPEIVQKGSLLYSFKLSVGRVGFNTMDCYTNEAIFSISINRLKSKSIGSYF